MSNGEVAAAAGVGPPPGMKVRLSSNESPFGPSPAVIDAIRELAPDAHLYPDDQARALRAALAAGHGVDEARIATGYGSAALLMDIIAHAIRSAPGAVLTYERSFIVYRLGAQTAGARYDEAPLGADYGRDADALLAAVRPDTRVVLIDNPGNPTGQHLDGDALRHVVSSLPDDVVVVIDEAYHHYAVGQRGYRTVEELGLEHPQLLVVRTFSKAHALAGLRIGYQLGQPDLIAALDRDRPRFNLGALAQAAALASLGDRAHIEATVQGTLAGREQMRRGLDELGVRCIDGLGNFLLVELGEPAEPVVDAYAAHGVGVRPLQPYGMHEQLRITVGTPDEVEAFLAATRAVLVDRPGR